jgi:protein-S-isoprenylcysteine O-methyltransferase Ste14
VKRSAPNFYEKYYRLLYSSLSVILLLPVAVLVFKLPDILIYRIPTPWVFGTVLVQVIALFLVLLAFRGTDTASFLGLRQVIHPSPEPEGLQTSGLYRFVRHPIYSLGMVIIWLFPWMTTNLLALFAASTLYLIVGAVFEEKKLRVLFAEYQAYQKQVPMFIPKLKI